jgi:hypothetical protein
MQGMMILVLLVVVLLFQLMMQILGASGIAAPSLNLFRKPLPQLPYSPLFRDASI